MTFESEINGIVRRLTVDRDTGFATDDSGKEIPFQIVHRDRHRLLLRSGTKIYRIDNIRKDGNDISFSIGGQFYDARVYNENDLLLKELGFSSNVTDTTTNILAPMPGKVLDILVREDDNIEEGQPVLILEAMKMENELRSTVHGTIQSIHVVTGENVEKNQLLIEFLPRG